MKKKLEINVNKINNPINSVIINKSQPSSKKNTEDKDKYVSFSINNSQFASSNTPTNNNNPVSDGASTYKVNKNSTTSNVSEKHKIQEKHAKVDMVANTVKNSNSKRISIHLFNCPNNNTLLPCATATNKTNKSISNVQGTISNATPKGSANKANLNYGGVSTSTKDPNLDKLEKQTNSCLDSKVERNEEYFKQGVINTTNVLNNPNHKNSILLKKNTSKDSLINNIISNYNAHQQQNFFLRSNNNDNLNRSNTKKSIANTIIEKPSVSNQLNMNINLSPTNAGMTSTNVTQINNTVANMTNTTFTGTTGNNNTNSTINNVNTEGQMSKKEKLNTLRKLVLTTQKQISLTEKQLKINANMGSDIGSLITFEGRNDNKVRKKLKHIDSNSALKSDSNNSNLNSSSKADRKKMSLYNISSNSKEVSSNNQTSENKSLVGSIKQILNNKKMLGKTKFLTSKTPKNYLSNTIMSAINTFNKSNNILTGNNAYASSCTSKNNQYGQSRPVNSKSKLGSTKDIINVGSVKGDEPFYKTNETHNDNINYTSNKQLYYYNNYNDNLDNSRDANDSLEKNNNLEYEDLSNSGKHLISAFQNMNKMLKGVNIEYSKSNNTGKQEAPGTNSIDKNAELKTKLDYYLYNNNNPKNKRSNQDELDVNTKHFNTTKPSIPIFNELAKTNTQTEQHPVDTKRVGRKKKSKSKNKTKKKKTKEKAIESSLNNNQLAQNSHSQISVNNNININISINNHEDKHSSSENKNNSDSSKLLDRYNQIKRETFVGNYKNKKNHRDNLKIDTDLFAVNESNERIKKYDMIFNFISSNIKEISELVNEESNKQSNDNNTSNSRIKLSKISPIENSKDYYIYNNLKQQTDPEGLSKPNTTSILNNGQELDFAISSSDSKSQNNCNKDTLKSSCKNNFSKENLNIPYDKSFVVSTINDEFYKHLLKDEIQNLNLANGNLSMSSFKSWKQSNTNNSALDKTQIINEVTDGIIASNINNVNEDLEYRLSSHFLNNRKKSPLTTSSIKHFKLDQDSGSGGSNDTIKMNKQSPNNTKIKTIDKEAKHASNEKISNEVESEDSLFKIIQRKVATEVELDDDGKLELIEKREQNCLIF